MNLLSILDTFLLAPRWATLPIKTCDWVILALLKFDTLCGPGKIVRGHVTPVLLSFSPKPCAC